MQDGHTTSEMSMKLSEMQSFFGLKVTGNMDPETLEMMREARCGVPDVASYADGSSSNKWPTNKLTYRYKGHSGLSPLYSSFMYQRVM